MFKEAQSVMEINGFLKKEGGVCFRKAELSRKRHHLCFLPLAPKWPGPAVGTSLCKQEVRTEGIEDINLESSLAFMAS